MLLDRYDFYDIHTVLCSIRSNPCAEYNADVIRIIKSILENPQQTNCIESNIIRNALRENLDIDKEMYYWVFIDNAYTYKNKMEKDGFYYHFLLNAFRLLLSCVQANQCEKLRDSADAFHNIPIFIADGCKNFKKSSKVQFSFYNNKYKTNLWKQLTKY